MVGEQELDEVPAPRVAQWASRRAVLDDPVDEADRLLVDGNHAVGSEFPERHLQLPLSV
jgi:hypothetical protein